MTDFPQPSPSPSLAPSSHPAVPSPLQWTILALILAVAAFLRIYQIDAPSLWMDEIWSIEMSTGRGSAHDVMKTGEIQTQQVDFTSLADAPPWWKIWTHMSGYMHPPLYHVILRWWMDCFGISADSVRGFSAAVSIIAVVVIFDVSRFLHGVRSALFAAAILALAISPIEFSQEARSYPMLIMLGLCCCDCLVRIEKFGPSPARLIALTLFTMALALTHYFTVGAFIALGLYALIRLRGKSRLKAWAAFSLAAVAVALLWVPELIAQIKSMPSLRPDYMDEFGSDHLRNTLTRVFSLPGEYLFGQTAAWQMPFPVQGLSIVLWAVGAVVIIIPLFRLRRRPDLLLWVLWIFGNLGFMCTFDLLRHTMMMRFLHYTMLSCPAVFALVAAFDWPRKPIVRDWLPIMVLLVLAILAGRRAHDGVAAIQQWREFATQLDSAAGSNELLVFCGGDPWVSPGFDYVALKYYAPTSNRPWLIVYGPFTDELKAKIDSYPSIWVVGMYPRDAISTLPGWKLVQPVIETTATTACHMINVHSHVMARAEYHLPGN